VRKITLDFDLEGEQSKRSKLEESERQRLRNALPVWHQQPSSMASVISDNSIELKDQDDDEQMTAVDIMDDCETEYNHVG
jgi:hypothetical protein